jgi:hypothetical protein
MKNQRKIKHAVQNTYKKLNRKQLMMDSIEAHSITDKVLVDKKYRKREGSWRRIAAHCDSLPALELME